MRIFNFCKHIYGKVDSKGYQYCEKCGKVNNVSLPDCQHEWKVLDKIAKNNELINKIIGFIYVQECIHCGVINKETVTLNDF